MVPLDTILQHYRWIPVFTGMTASWQYRPKKYIIFEDPGKTFRDRKYWGHSQMELKIKKPHVVVIFFELVFVALFLTMPLWLGNKLLWIWLSFLIIGVSNLFLKCPKCYYPITKSRYGFWRPFASRECQNCGYNLSEGNAIYSFKRGRLQEQFPTVPDHAQSKDLSYKIASSILWVFGGFFICAPLAALTYSLLQMANGVAVGKMIPGLLSFGFFFFLGLWIILPNLFGKIIFRNPKIYRLSSNVVNGIIALQLLALFTATLFANETLKILPLIAALSVFYFLKSRVEARNR